MVNNCTDEEAYRFVITKKMIFLLFGMMIRTTSIAQTDIFSLVNHPNPPLKKIQKAVEYNLKNSRFYDFYEKDEYIRIPKPYQYNFFTERAKSRILELLKNTWTKKEIESHLNIKLAYELDTLNSRNSFYKRVKRIAKRDSIPIDNVWGQMLDKRSKAYKKLITDQKVPGDIVLLAGYLKDERFIPYLKTLATDTAYYYNYEAQLALAHYTIEPYHIEMVKKNSYSENLNFNSFRNRLENLAYICSKESLQHYYKFCMSTDKVYNSHENGYDYMAEKAIIGLSFLLKNNEMYKEIENIKMKYMKSGMYDENYLKEIQDVANRYFSNMDMNSMDCESIQLDVW
ncbi:hypothetical protein [Aquimarina megaterium]|uniref:hypothetical protein n=1 Tax=Aquimarina megaterium TaxID=1443666 RepID=UPI000943E8FC|nr:hypothetical protein [Aquimarina megaterium]